MSVNHEQATYYLREGEQEDGSQLDLVHHGQPLTVKVGTPVNAPIPPIPDPGPRPEQPPHRAPMNRTTE